MTGEEIFPETGAENSEDEASIMADKDQTLKARRPIQDVEDEPEDFIEGDVDVKTQMDRTEQRLRNHLDGGNGDRGRHEDDRIPNA